MSRFQTGNLHLKATEPLTESLQHEAHFERPTAFVTTSLQLPREVRILFSSLV